MEVEEDKPPDPTHPIQQMGIEEVEQFLGLSDPGILASNVEEKVASGGGASATSQC